MRLFNPSSAPLAPVAGTVSDVVAAFLRAKSLQHQLGRCAAKSLESLRETLQDFESSLGGRLVTDLSNDDLIEWICDHSEWVSPHTQTHRQGLVVTAFRWAADEKRMIPFSPFRRTAKLFKTLQPRLAITETEFADLMRAARNGRGHRKSRRALRLALIFLWETGCRTCEMRALIWSQIDLGAGVAFLDEHKTADATGQLRVIPFTPKLARLLRWLRRRTSPAPQDRVFLNGRGRPWQAPGFARLFRRYGKLAGIRPEISPYSIRHGFCCRGLANNVGQRQIADVMGHKTTRYIEWYARSARSNVDYLRGVLEAINTKK